MSIVVNNALSLQNQWLELKTKLKYFPICIFLACFNVEALNRKSKNLYFVRLNFKIVKQSQPIIWEAW